MFQGLYFSTRDLKKVVEGIAGSEYNHRKPKALTD
jgi:hypothetical protein